MAIKRALVGATLQATGASGLFTQDLEDLTDFDQPKQQKQQQSSKPSSGQHHSNPHPKAQAIEMMKKLDFSWDDLAGVATDVLKRPIKKVITDIKTEGEWKQVEDILSEMLENRMNEAQPIDEEKEIDIKDDDLPF